MSDAGNILPQAEIDALFKQATGRSLSTPPEVEAAKIIVAQEKPAPVKEPATKVQVKEKPATQPAQQAASKPKPAPAPNPAPAAAPSPAPPPPPAPPPNNAEIDRILDVLERLTKRIDAIEQNISEISGTPAGNPELENSVRILSRKVNSESETIRKINGQMAKMMKNLKGTPGYGARESFTCGTCGSHGYLAVPMKCSSCGTEGWWGWYPEKGK